MTTPNQNTMSNPIQNRYEFILFFDATNCNPNGDPDSGNMPRLDPQTGIGLVSDVAIKRRLRNFVSLAHSNEPPNSIFVQHGTTLNKEIARAHAETGGIQLVKGAFASTSKKVSEAKAWMCQRFWDVRTFGAVMSTGPNAGQVRGPVQIAFSQSLHPILPMDVAITRGATANDGVKSAAVADWEKWEADQPEDQLRTMGRKTLIPYGLYVCQGFVSAPLAEQTGFSEDDLHLLWQALGGMFDQDHSSSKNMSSRRLIVFKHTGEGSLAKLGVCHSHKLVEVDTDRLPLSGAVVSAKLKEPTDFPRSFGQYQVTLHRDRLPAGVEAEEIF
jgi:CRISPR-associated protein Csd2